MAHAPMLLITGRYLPLSLCGSLESAAAFSYPFSSMSCTTSSTARSRKSVCSSWSTCMYVCMEIVCLIERAAPAPAVPRN